MAADAIIRLNQRELATVLAALRHWQDDVLESWRKEDWPEHFAEVEPMSDNEIDTLCERINAGGF